MKYLTYALLLVGVLVGSPVACDSEKQAGADGDAGADSAAEQKKQPSTPKKKDEKAESTDDRPTAASDESGTIDEKPPLQIDSYLTTSDFREMAEVSDAEQTELPGRDPSPEYNAHRIRPTSGDGYGAGLQVWALDKPDAAAKRLSELRSQYLNVEKLSATDSDKAKTFGEGAFVSKRGGIRNVVFRIEEPPRVAAVSCSVESCSSLDAALELATKVRSRMDESGT